MNFLSDTKNWFKEHINIILLISIIINILLLSLCIYLYINTNKKECINLNTETEEIKDEDTTNFFVEVKGAVVNPGVYMVNNEKIINDVIVLAGGFKENAYTKNINLSKKVSKELVIYIFSNDEYKKLNLPVSKNTTTKTSTCIVPSYDINKCIDKGISEIIPKDDKQNDNTTNQSSNNTNSNNNTNTSNNTNNNEEVIEINDNDNIEEEQTNDNENNNTNENNSLININTATKEELLTLNGIGESKANKIIEYRNSNGYFTKIEDILNVSGIGQSIYEKIKDYITI